VHLPLKRATRASNSRAVSAQLFSALTGGQRFPVMIGVIWLAICSPHLHSAFAVANHLPYPRAGRLRVGGRWKGKRKQ
jgi:hypothetical protein